MAKNKKGICMADGGITKETPDQLMARMSAKYGAPAAGPVQSAPVQQPAPQPVPKPQAPQQGIAAGIRGMFGNRQQQLDEQERKANGMANGGIVRGKGTPTSDDVPVKIKGEDYNLSDTEAVLPSKTRQALGEILGAKPGDVAQANKLVEAFIEKTNGKPPVSVNEGVNLANGGLLDEEARKMNYQAVTGVQAPAPTPAPVAQPDSGGWSIGKSGLGSNVQVTTGDAARLPAPVVQEGIATMRGQLAPAPTPAKPNFGDNSQAGLETRLAAMQAANGTTPVNTASGPTVSDGAGGVYTPETGASGAGILSGITNFFKDSAQAARGDKAYEQIRAERAAGNPSAPAAAGQPASNGQTAFKADPFGPAADKFAAPADGAGTLMTGKAQYDDSLNKTGMAAPDSSGGGFTQGKTSYNVNPSSQDGISKITATGKNPLYTNIKPEDAVSGLKNQKIGGDAADVQQGLDRFARANAITQSIIDKQPQGGVAVLNDPNEAANAEKTARWRQDDLISQASRGNQAAIASAMQSVPEMLKAGIMAKSDENRNAVAMRGQDLTAQNESARLNNPADVKLKDAQAKGILAKSDSEKLIADLQRRASEGDQQAMVSLRAINGKSQTAADRYVTVQGGEEIGPNGMTKIKRPSGVFDAQQGKFVSMDGSGAQKAQPAPASAVDYLKKNPAQAEAFKAKYGYPPEGF